MVKVKPLSSLSRLEAEKQSKKTAAELGEEIDATGQESEAKGAKWVQEQGVENEQERLSFESRLKEVLDSKSKHTIVDYTRTVAEMMTNLARGEEYPGFWHVVITDKGVVMYLEIEGRKFYRAFKPTGQPDYDLVAIKKVLESMWVQIERVKDDGKRRNFLSGSGN